MLHSIYMKYGLDTTPPLLQKAFLLACVLFLAASFLTSIHLLRIAYPDLHTMRFSSLSLMACSLFVVPLLSFLAFYFVGITHGKQLHRAFISALLSVIFVIIHDLLQHIAFIASQFPIIQLPLPINPYEILAAMIALLLLIGTVVIVRSTAILSIPPSPKQLNRLGAILVSLFVASQLVQFVFLSFSTIEFARIELPIAFAVFLASYIAARHRSSNMSFFRAVITTTITLQVLLSITVVWSIFVA